MVLPTKSSRAPFNIPALTIVVYDSVADKAIFSNPVAISTPITFGIWHTISQEVTASSSGTLRIHLFRLQGTGTVHWDDVHVFEDE
jgi:hypothetical protein